MARIYTAVSIGNAANFRTTGGAKHGTDGTTGDVALAYDTTAVVTRSMLRKAVMELLALVEGNGTLTP